MNPAPPDLGITLTTKQAAAALGMPERTLRRHLKAGTIQGAQVWHHSPWLIPTSEVERLCRLLWITPDWRAAQELANLADPASQHASAATTGDLEHDH